MARANARPRVGHVERIKRKEAKSFRYGRILLGEKQGYQKHKILERKEVLECTSKKDGS